MYGNNCTLYYRIGILSCEHPKTTKTNEPAPCRVLLLDEEQNVSYFPTNKKAGELLTMTSTLSIQTAAVDPDLPWDSYERVQKSPPGRRRQRQLSPWSNCVSSYRYATNSFVGDLLANSKITMLHKTHKENFSKTFAHGESFLVKDSQNPFLLMRNVSDRLLQENDEDNFYNAIRSSYSPNKRKIHRPPRNLDQRNPNTSKHLLATFYGRHVRETTTTDLTKLSDHLCFDDGDDKVYNYSMRSSSLLASAAHPLLRPSLLHFRNRKRPLSKGRNCHRRGSTTSCSTLSSFESFSSFTHKNESSSPDDKRSSSVLGSSLRILMQTNHHQKVAPTTVAKQTNFENIILNIEQRFRDIEITGNTTEEHDIPKTKEPTEKQGNKKSATDYNRSEASLDFCLLEKPRTKKRFDHDDKPLSIFQPSVSSTQAESSSGIVFLFDSNVPV